MLVADVITTSLSFLAGSHHEADVHQGTVLLGGGTYEQGVAVDFAVQEVGLLLVDLLDGLYAAHALDPLEGLVHDEDVEHGRGVEHGELVNVGLVLYVP